MHKGLRTHNGICHTKIGYKLTVSEHNDLNKKWTRDMTQALVMAAREYAPT